MYIPSSAGSVWKRCQVEASAVKNSWKRRARLEHCLRRLVLIFVAAVLLRANAVSIQGRGSWRGFVIAPKEFEPDDLPPFNQLRGVGLREPFNSALSLTPTEM